MISVIKDGVQVRGWKSVSVGLSMSTICNGFSLSQFAGDGNAQPVLFPGDAVRIEVDGELLLDGFVDSLSSSFSSGSHTIEVNGREKTCDIVDCSMDDFGRTWKNKTVAQIVGSVCDCFGVRFMQNGVSAPGTLTRFCPDPGCTGADIIADACRQKDVVCTSDGCGNVSFVNDNFESVDDFIRQGVNIISADVSFDNSARFSDYVVLCSGDPKTKRRGKSSDGEITRPRCMVLVDEGFGNIDGAEKRAAFEAQSRSARSTVLNVRLSGWKRSNGQLWRPGCLVDCLVPAFFGNFVQTLLVNSVALSYDPSGSFVDLELVRRDYYTRPPAKSGKPGKSKADPWAGIREKTRKSEGAK